MWHFDFFLNTGVYGGWKFENASPPTVFMRSQSNLMKTMATMVDYRILLFWTIAQVTQFCGTLKF